MENSECDMQYHLGLSTGDNIPIVRDDMPCAGSEGHDSCQVVRMSPAAPTCPGLAATAHPSPPLLSAG